MIELSQARRGALKANTMQKTLTLTGRGFVIGGDCVALMKFCGCGAMIPRGEAGCAKCMARWAEREAERQKEYDLKVRNRKDYTWVYKDKRWLSVRAEALLRDEYMCVRCRKNGVDKPADMVHHIVPISECVSNAFDLDNLMSLCDGEDGCHDKEHMAIRKRYKRKSK